MAEPAITVWIDRSALAIETRVGRSTTMRESPDAAAALRHLADAGCRVVLVGPATKGDTVDPADAGPAIEQANSLPANATGWFVTDDPGRCGETRGRRVTTILVGPSEPNRGLAHRASDLEARDLVDAALLVLTADAMPDAGLPARA